MLAVLLETEARRSRRGAGLVIAIGVHVALGAVLLRARPHPALALAGPDEAALRAPVVARPAAPGAPPTGARTRSERPAAPAAPSAPSVPVVAPVEMAGGLPSVDLARGVGDKVEFASRPVAVPHGRGAADRGPAADHPFEVAGVDRPAVALAGNPPPVYPEALRRAGRAGEVVVQFVVDTLGRAEPGSLVVVRASEPALAEAVAAVLPRWRFAPAEAGGRRVRMLVRQPVAFGVTP